MNRQIPFFFFMMFFTFLFPNGVDAQISQKSTPPSVSQKIINDDFPTITTPAPDVKRLLDEDAFTDKHGIAMRFAVSSEVKINLVEQGKWMRLSDGSSICRLAINSKNARALILYYDEFSIPKGGKLFLYNDGKNQAIGAFTNQNNKNGGTFATEMIYGETTILEYYQPAGLNEKPYILIGEVSYVYRAAHHASQNKGFGGSDTCEVNVECPEGNDWTQQAKGVARVIVKTGMSQVWCSGALLNNTLQDHTPYFFTADHCGPNASANDYDNWIFYFRYQGSSCENPTSDTSFNSFTMVGASKLAAAGGSGVLSDFKLLVLNESIPLNYEPFYNGWSAINEPSPEGVTIHHPQGDIKKISTYTQPLISSNWGSTPNTHWKVVWSETQTNWGVTEGGSSGSPIFSDEGLLVGHLTGGDASCSYLTGPDYYGKFSYSWDQIGGTASSQLKPWLDPDNSGILKLDGLVSVNVVSPEKENIMIYPNPTEGQLFINFNDTFPERVNTVSVLDISGRKVIVKHIEADNSSILELNLSALQSGVYFVVFDLKDSQQIIKKIIR